MITQIVFSIIGAFLSVILTKIFIQNGRHIRNLGESMEENRKEARQFLEKMSEEISKLGNLIIQEAKLTRGVMKEGE